ncbi:uncharacterized protein KY384_001273 [Bacidia gigantensis]|uniref:uncharacterized protein n=1 Tax=Bacidia gigantensis TaxID=2732470 RepID=UPI001D03EB52|nr:uncharacterized protein KY384_001273 [Bacidia gigantensis]KAG8533533.1 hypothetical protein KY384_001273 [Bacidia gigantensis]
MASPSQQRILNRAGAPTTPLILAAADFAKTHLSPPTFNHVMRSLGLAFAIAKNRLDSKTMDDEVVAVACILHDLGWSSTPSLISADKRFEVDGADAARAFLLREAPHWVPRRVQLVWDAVALHSTNSIALFKEVEVAAVARGVTADFGGPGERVEDGSEGVERGEYEAVVEAFPRTGFVDEVVRVHEGFCRSKPETTYDNYVRDVGEELVEGYSIKGHTFLDRLKERTKPLESK